jgi:hypothetical protein
MILSIDVSKKTNTQLQLPQHLLYNDLDQKLNWFVETRSQVI